MTSIVTATVIVATTSTTIVAADTAMMVVVPILPTEYMISISTVTHGVLPVGASVVVVVAEGAKSVVEVTTCVYDE